MNNQCQAKNHTDKSKRCGKAIDETVSMRYCYWHWKEIEYIRPDWMETLDKETADKMGLPALKEGA